MSKPWLVLMPHCSWRDSPGAGPWAGGNCSKFPLLCCILLTQLDRLSVFIRRKVWQSDFLSISARVQDSGSASLDSSGCHLEPRCHRYSQVRTRACSQPPLPSQKARLQFYCTFWSVWSRRLSIWLPSCWGCLHVSVNELSLLKLAG